MATVLRNGANILIRLREKYEGASLHCFSFDSQYNHSETLRMNTQNATRTRKESIRDTHCDEQNQEPR